MINNIDVQNNVPVVAPPNGSKADSRSKAEETVTEEDVKKDEQVATFKAGRASELVSVFSVLLVLIVAFAGLDWITSASKPAWQTNSAILGFLIGGVAICFAGIGIFSWQAVQDVATEACEKFVLSEWSLKTLKAAGLPADIGDCLSELLERAKEFSASTVELTAYDRERKPDTWIAELESILGRPRVAEYEEMLFKYTARPCDKTEDSSS